MARGVTYCDEKPQWTRGLPEMPAPMLVVVGEHEDLDNQSIASRLELEVEHVEGMMVADAGNALNLERPEKFNRIVPDLLVQHDVG